MRILVVTRGTSVHLTSIIIRQTLPVKTRKRVREIGTIPPPLVLRHNNTYRSTKTAVATFVTVCSTLRTTVRTILGTLLQIRTLRHLSSSLKLVRYMYQLTRKDSSILTEMIRTANLSVASPVILFTPMLLGLINLAQQAVPALLTNQV
jgi:hypothetical protein